MLKTTSVRKIVWSTPQILSDTSIVSTENFGHLRFATKMSVKLDVIDLGIFGFQDAEIG